MTQTLTFMNWYVYDFFNRRPNGFYWISSLNPLGIHKPDDYIAELDSKIQIPFGKIRAESLSSSNYIGGLKTENGKIAVFRLYNGGFDVYQRPNRWVMLVAELETGEFKSSKGLDVCAILESSVFQEYASTLVPAEAPIPEQKQVFTWSESVSSTLPFQEKQIEGSDAKTQIRNLSLELSSSDLAQESRTLFVRKKDSGYEAILKIQIKTENEITLPSPPKTDEKDIPPIDVPSVPTPTPGKNKNKKGFLSYLRSFAGWCLEKILILVALIIVFKLMPCEHEEDLKELEEFRRETGTVGTVIGNPRFMRPFRLGFEAAKKDNLDECKKQYNEGYSDKENGLPNRYEKSTTPPSPKPTEEKPNITGVIDFITDAINTFKEKVQNFNPLKKKESSPEEDKV